MIGLDSSTIIDFFKNDESLRKLLETISMPLVINRISYLEIMFGLDFSNPSHKIEEEFYDRLFDSLLIFDLREQACKKSTEIFWQLKRSGKIIDLFDCTIAGIYLANGVNKIITRNVKHFENIKELKVISY